MAPIRANDFTVSFAGFNGEITARGEVVLDSLARRKPIPSGASALVQVLSARVQIIEGKELHQRVAALKEKLK